MSRTIEETVDKIRQLIRSGRKVQAISVAPDVFQKLLEIICGDTGEVTRRKGTVHPFVCGFRLLENVLLQPGEVVYLFEDEAP